MTAPTVLETAMTEADEVDAWLAEHGVGDGFFMLSSATPLKTNGEEDCKTPMKANLALDTPKPINDLGISPKQIYSDFKKNQEAAIEGGGSIRFRSCSMFFALLPPGRVASHLPHRTSRVTSPVCRRASSRQSDLPSMPLITKSRLCFAR